MRSKGGGEAYKYRSRKEKRREQRKNARLKVIRKSSWTASLRFCVAAPSKVVVTATALRELFGARVSNGRDHVSAGDFLQDRYIYTDSKGVIHGSSFINMSDIYFCLQGVFVYFSMSVVFIGGWCLSVWQCVTANGWFMADTPNQREMTG